MPNEKRERFNLETMSGIYPGTRTKVFQRVALSDALRPNAQVAWYDDPVACVAKMDGADDALLRVEASLDDEAGRATFWAALLAGLEKANKPLRACGTCTHWQETAAVTPDGLVLGPCNFGNARSVDNELAAQSVLALACSHWSQQEAQTAPSNPLNDGSRAAVVNPDEMARPEGAATEPRDADAQQENSFILKNEAKAEAEGKSQIEGESEGHGNHGGIFSRLKNLFGQNPPKPSPKSFLERSGVGAGTESCFACQGRIANLGALVVQTDEGDKQTVSVWRCRNCYSVYLNNWIDRWERLDNLETEEVYYRLAPSEALMLLQEIDSVQNGDHPQGSADRGTQRAIFTNFMADRESLSHQIKHGR